MADRYPLIANASANQIQELGNADNLDLTGNNFQLTEAIHNKIERSHKSIEALKSVS